MTWGIMKKLLVAALLFVACGAPTVVPKVEVTGTVGGETLKPLEAALGEAVSGRGRIDTLLLVVTEATGACENVKADKTAHSTTTLALTLKNDRGDTLKPGSYPIIAGFPSGSSGNYAKGTISKRDAACADAYAGDAGTFTEGTVTLSTWTEAGSATGEFDLTVGSDHLTGKFAANTCAGVTEANVATADVCN